MKNDAVIGEKGESVAEYGPEGEDKPVKEEHKTEPAGEVKDEMQADKPEVVIGEKRDEVKISPRAKNMAEKLGVPYFQISGSGPDGRIIERDIEAYAKSGGKLTGLAYDMASSEGLAAAATGSGIGGRVLASELSQQPVPANEFEEIKLTNIRRIIAENMHASLQNSAQLTHHMSADARKILAYRAKIKEKADAGELPNITLNDLVCFGVIKALKKMPEINAHFLGDSIRVFRKVHLGVAIDTERGLMVPSLRNADDMTIEELSVNLKKLADNCKKGNIDPELLASTAATFTVSNLGVLGVEMFTPVINLPQAGILGINTIIQRPADTGDGIIGFVPFLGLSLTYDHRVLDGAPASVFLREVKLQIENLEINI